MRDCAACGQAIARCTLLLAALASCRCLPLVHRPSDAAISTLILLPSFAFHLPCSGLVVGRVVVGVGIGIAATVVPAYLGEVAPAKGGWLPTLFCFVWHTQECVATVLTGAPSQEALR